MAPCQSRPRFGSHHIGAPWEGSRDRRPRDPFPLPLLSTSVPAEARPNSTKSRRRLYKRLEFNSRVNETIQAVNELAAGGSQRRSTPLRRPTEVVLDVAEARSSQQWALRLFRARVLAVADSLPAKGSGVALRELLRSSDGGYGSARGALAAYVAGMVSLPSVPGDVRSLLDLLSEEWRREYSPANLLREPQEVAEDLEGREGEFYMDPVLKNDPVAYAEFVAALVRAGMLRFDLSQKAVSPPFFVSKDDEGALRALFDCRRVNELFKDPPATRLCSVESLSHLQVSDILYSTG